MWIIDTNVVVSALISKKTDNPPRRIIQKMLKGEIIFWLSQPLFEEYRQVLHRAIMNRLMLSQRNS